MDTIERITPDASIKIRLLIDFLKSHDEDTSMLIGGDIYILAMSVAIGKSIRCVALLFAYVAHEMYIRTEEYEYSRAEALETLQKARGHLKDVLKREKNLSFRCRKGFCKEWSIDTTPRLYYRIEIPKLPIQENTVTKDVFER